MPPVVQLIPCTACLFFFFLPGLGPVLSVLMSPLPRVAVSIRLWPRHITLSLLFSLSLYLPLGSLTSLFLSVTPSSPLYPIFLSFIPLYFAPQLLLHNLPLPVWTFAALPEVLQWTDSSAISDTVRHMEGCWAPTLGDFTSAAEYPWCITDKDVTGRRQIGCKWHKTLAPAARTEEVVLYKHQTQSNSASAALYSLSE